MEHYNPKSIVEQGRREKKEDEFPHGGAPLRQPPAEGASVTNHERSLSILMTTLFAGAALACAHRPGNLAARGWER